jgi:hypothetical protein
MALLYCSYLPVESCFTPPLAHVLQHVDLWRVLCLKPQALDSALFMQLLVFVFRFSSVPFSEL